MERFLKLSLLLALAGCLCGCATAQNRDTNTTFRVMTFNIHHGEGLDGKVDLLRIAQLVKEQRADIVGLQEVDKGVARTAGRDLPAELAELTGMTCVFSNNYAYQGGEYGNAVLTRFPVIRAANSHFKMLIASEPRGVQQLILDVRGRRVAFINTHLDAGHSDADRWSEVEQLEKILKLYRGMPLLMTGDFNDAPDSRVARRLAENYRDTWKLVGEGEGPTIPVSAPRKRIDYIWISKDKSLVPVKAAVLRSDASDHLPVLAEFELR